MSDVAIRVEGLGKQYRIGGKQERFKTLRDTLADTLTAPIRGLASLARRGPGPNGKHPPKYEELWALRDVTFEVKTGEALGIIGRNGAGKSTLLKILSRITEPTEGVVDIYGRVASLLEVGTGFHQELTGRENIYLNGAILGMKRSEIERRFDEIVGFAEVDKFVDTPVKHYSSGMYLRLAFAVAAHLDPEILLIDEVLAVGDAAFQRKCLGKMADVAQQGRTVLFVSHNLAAIGDLTQRCLWIDDGRVVDNANSEDVITHYLTSSAAIGLTKGFASLIRKPLGELESRRATFEWIRLRNFEGVQTDTYKEDEAITVEIGIYIAVSVSSLQWGCGIVRQDKSIELFTIPSDEVTGHIVSGNYATRFELNPNYLREGSYTITLKLFANGIRQETRREVYRFVVVRNIALTASKLYHKRWVNGPLKFDYKWRDMEQVDRSGEISASRQDLAS